MTDAPRTSSLRTARRLLAAAQEAWPAVAEQVATAAHGRIVAAARPHPVAVTVLERHAPSGTTAGSPACGWCPAPDNDSCGDPWCCGEPEPAAWPCVVVADVAAKVGHTIVVDVPPYPTLGDYYDEPDVTITVSHPIELGGVWRRPGEEVTVPLSAAPGRYRMTAESWTTVERMRSA